MIWGKTKLLRVRGRFKLSKVRVTREGKIREKVWRKSRGSRFWFGLARVRVIESQLYVYKELNQNNWEPKNVFVQVPTSFFHSNIYNWWRRRSTATLRKTNVECIEKQAIRTVGLVHPSPPPKGDRFIWIHTRTFSLTSDKVLILRFIWILTRTFSLTSDKVLILKKQPQ